MKIDLHKERKDLELQLFKLGRLSQKGPGGAELSHRRADPSHRGAPGSRGTRGTSGSPIFEPLERVGIGCPGHRAYFSFGGRTENRYEMAL